MHGWTGLRLPTPSPPQASKVMLWCGQRHVILVCEADCKASCSLCNPLPMSQSTTCSKRKERKAGLGAGCLETGQLFSLLACRRVTRRCSLSRPTAAGRQGCPSWVLELLQVGLMHLPGHQVNLDFPSHFPPNSLPYHLPPHHFFPFSAARRSLHILLPSSLPSSAPFCSHLPA